MKWHDKCTDAVDDKVAPFTGAWVEIWCRRSEVSDWLVAPFTGAWVEMINVLSPVVEM